MERFDVINGILFVETDLDMSSDVGLEEEFQSACDRLVACDASKLYIDLTKVKYVSSLAIGIIMGAFGESQEKGKEIIIKVSPKLSPLFKSIADNAMNIQVVE